PSVILLVVAFTRLSVRCTLCRQTSRSACHATPATFSYLFAAHPRSTPFPYTTLFRSELSRSVRHVPTENISSCTLPEEFTSSQQADLAEYFASGQPARCAEIF